MKKKKLSYKNSHWIFSGIAVVFVLFIIMTQTSAALSAQVVGEKIMMKIFPSGERAFEYGDRHLDGQDPSQYDVEAAENFFKQAVKLDPELLYVHHQLARIAFLKGDFVTALFQINLQIQKHADETPNSYYVRGLIEGYMGDYGAAAKDYEEFLKVDPRNWAAVNDLAWVLLEDNRPQEAADATEEGLKYFPENPWLLKSSVHFGEHITGVGCEEVGKLLLTDLSLNTNACSDARPTRRAKRQRQLSFVACRSRTCRRVCLRS